MAARGSDVAALACSPFAARENETTDESRMQAQ
jgi:hypothetical protein